MKSILSLAVVAVTLTGCASAFTVGSKGEKCPFQDIEGAGCVGMREVYTASENPNFDPKAFRETKAQERQNNGQGPKEEPGFLDYLFGKSDQKTVNSSNGNNTNLEKLQEQVDSKSANVIPWMDKPVPVRSQAKVMRIFIAPVLDADGDVTAPGLVYTEVEQRRWAFGEEMVQRPARFSAVNGAPVAGSEPANMSRAQRGGFNPLAPQSAPQEQGFFQ